MTIKALQITHFRNLIAAEVAPSEQFNIISGSNGSGKTSLLEAIHCLGTGRSFRSSTIAHAIYHHAQQFSLFAQLMTATQQSLSLGMERSISGTTRLRLAGQEAASLADLAESLPLRIIHSQSHLFFEAGPLFRRKYLDWGLFYHLEGFLPCWQQYERALKQRNTLLKNKRPKSEIDPWTDALVTLGIAFDQFRRQYLALLLPCATTLIQEILDINQIEMTYDPGWKENQSYLTTLEAAYSEELRMGYTRYGPHRADLIIHINNTPVKHILSRGQQKLLICAMIIAQGMLLTQHKNKKLVYLVDDLPSELDVISRQKLINLLAKQCTQVFMTAIEKEALHPWVDETATIASTHMFHVKNGVITLK